MLNSDYTRSGRRHEVDTLRGAALFGICIVNVPFLAGLDILTPATVPADKLADFAIALLFQGKFFVLFSFLFGWGFAIQLASAERANRDFRKPYLRRMLGLFLFGVLHALFVFIGDILVLYSILGLALLPMRRLSPARLLRIAVGLLALAFFALAALGVILSEPYLPTEYETGYLGSFADAFVQRWYEWPYGLGFILLFNGPLALASFCVGLAAAKTNFFDDGAESYAALKKHGLLLLVIGLALNTCYALASTDRLGDGIPALMAFAGLAVGGPCLASVYLIAIVELSRRGVLAGSRAAGRMSLTAYIAEGVLAGLLFNGYGLAYYGQIGPLGCVGVAMAIYIIVHLLCSTWLRWQRGGPLERLLRWMTNR